MRNVALFVEDFAHETFLKAVVRRPADDHHVQIAFQPYRAQGGRQRRMNKRDSAGKKSENAEAHP